ncbi:DNA polymerase III subunit gamma/tau [bacterium]|nr:DNA polymerase III subunit gamma/tau [candidate division CSSED10-310 bacterium]
MSYIVLARKWRPQTFDEIIGQKAIARTLANSIRIGRIGHAFLFSGPRGVGKTSCARILSKALNCEQGPTAEPCNRCRFCEEITTGTSLDVLEIDGASNRGIDEIRELRENVRYAPAAARFKIFIIDEVHMLTREAFNALLKTLEEPPEHVKFILATTEAHKVPVTIVSRCQRYDFRRIDPVSLKAALSDICRKESIAIEPVTVDVLARIADGSLRDGLSLLDQVISFSGNAVEHQETMRLLGRVDPHLIFDIFRSLSEGNAGGAMERFGEYIETGGDEVVFNREMMEATRDLMAVKLNGTARYEIPAGLADVFSIDQLERIFKVLLDLEVSLRSSEFPRLIADVALVKMSRIRSLTPLENLIARMSVPGDVPVPAPTPARPSARLKAPPKTRPDGLLPRIIELIPETKSHLKAMLEYGAIVKEDPDRLVIGFKPEHDFCLRTLNQPGVPELIGGVGSEVLSRKVSVSFVSGEPDTPPSPAEENSARKKKEADQRMKMALENDFVSDMVNSFDSRIRDIRLRDRVPEPEREMET